MAMMEEGARSCLLQSRSNLEQDIRASYLMDHMISDGVLTGDEEERIRSKPTRREQAAALLELLLRKDNQAYISFYNALVRESYGDLASLLHNSLPLVSPEAEKSFSDAGTHYVQTVLSEGGVPQRPVVFVSRPALVNRVREKLYRLQKEPGWCFPGGVHWLSIGQLDRADLLVRIQSLCFRLEQQCQEQDPSSSLHRPPGSLEEAKERLRFLMLRRYPRSLLILDDIWDSSVLKAFDIQCRVLLTTRDRSLADCVSGSPLVVSLIGALLREFPDRWAYYLRMLQQKKFKRIRKSSSYDYDALDQAMAASIQVLSEEHRELYIDLTVLEKDVKVPAKELYSLMFSLDWVRTKAQIMGPAHLINDYVEYGAILDKENSEVRGHFQEFLSLNGHQLEQRPFPDVVQLALSQPDSSEVNKSSLKSLSRLVVQPHQGSIYSACFSHDGTKIASCGSSKTLRVFKSTSGEKLLEIQAHDDEVLCCAFSSDDHLLATCSSDRKVKVWNVERGTLMRVFEDEHEEQVNHCQFTNTRRRLLLATCSNDKFINTKVFDVETAAMLLEIRTSRLSTVQYCHACPSSNLVAIALSHYAVELWDIETNKKMADCSGHLSWVHGVQFSPDGSLLLSCSDDQTVRVWETNKVHTSSAVCLKRDSDVLFNNGDVTVVAADNRNRLQVRNGRTGAVMFQSEEQESRIRCTAICTQTSAVGLGREDGTIQYSVLQLGPLLGNLFN
ncbi:unnamed protein product, partial [Coregonus sp. 'balchen']